MARIRLVTRGDDAGSCRSANRAILEAAQAGILKNVSIMAPGPAFAEAAELLQGLSGVALGLHATLNAEWDTVKWGPVLPREDVPDLVDAGGNLLATPMQLHERQASADQMIAEVAAQLRLAREHGLRITYLDEHMGIGWLAGLKDRIAELAQREGILYAEGFPGLRPVPEEPAEPAARLLARVDAAPNGTYVFVTHPGMDAEDMRVFVHAGLEPGQIARERDTERRMWTDLRLAAELAARGVECVRYDQAVAAE